MRRKLAQRLLGFASHWWTDSQIKQLLLRTLRNQISASRQHRTAAGEPEQKISNRIEIAGGQCGALTLVSTESQPSWRKSARAPESKCGKD